MTTRLPSRPLGTPPFLFATDIENSYPTIRDARGHRVRVDEMKKCGHYRHWQTDFALVEELGARVLRYGPPIHTTWLGDGRYDWAFADLTFGALRRRDLPPIVDLCHVGVPDWLGDFQNPDSPERLARYARDFAARSPWVQFSRRATRRTCAPNSRVASARVPRVRNDGAPMLGFTWYSLTDQVDWDTALREDNGRTRPNAPPIRRRTARAHPARQMPRGG